MEQQLDIFAFEEHSSEVDRTSTRMLGFENRKRVYDCNDNYMYMKILSETGVRLIIVSITIEGHEILEMSDSDYKRWLKSNNYKEVEEKSNAELKKRRKH